MSQLKKSEPASSKTIRATNAQGFMNLIELAVHILKTRPRDAATAYAIRCLIREATLKAAKEDKTRVHFITRAALHYRKIGQNENTVREHIIPVSVAMRPIRDKVPGVEELAEAVKNSRLVAIITNKEHARLDKAGLRKKMPEDWDEKDPFARYAHVGIKLRPSPEDIKM